MRALLRWRIWQNRGMALFLLVALALAAAKAFDLDRLTAILYLFGLSQGAIWGGLALLFVLYRRDVQAASRGELGTIFLLPAGPTRFALAQAAELLFWTIFLEGGLLLAGAFGVGRFYPTAPGELLRMGLYLFCALVLPALGVVQLATASDLAYRLGRVGGLAAFAVAFGIPTMIGKILEPMSGSALWQWGPKVEVGSFHWLTGKLPGLSLLAPSGLWPAWPLALGALFFLLCLALALRIYHELEL